MSEHEPEPPADMSDFPEMETVKDPGLPVPVFAIALAAIVVLVLILTSLPAHAEVIPKLVGHRGVGDSDTIGENTLEAFQYAVDNSAAMVEFDVQITSDAKMVVIHDATLDRTTNCTGPVKAKTLTQVKACTTDIGHSHPPSLRQTLNLLKPTGKLLHIEMKQDWTRAQVGRLAKELRTQGVADRSRVLSFDKSNVSDLKAVDPGIRRGIAWKGSPPSISYIKGYGSQFDLDLAHASASFVKKCKDNGVTLYLWTADSTADYWKLSDIQAPYWGVQNTAAAQEWLSS